MSIDDKFLRDTRVTQLGLDLGISRWETMGRLLAVFAVCYDLERDVLTTAQIDLAAEKPGFADAVFAVDLAINVRGGLRIRGAGERIEYLNHKSRAGHIGGVNSGLSRQIKAKQNSKQTPSDREARGNLPDPVPDLVPDPVPDGVPDQERDHVVATPARGRRPGKQAATPAELAAVSRVLERLGRESGVAYGGAAEHVRLIVGRLRDGVTELELRAVVAYCADEWKGDEKMRRYLRPETLFGPSTIAKYLDPARARYRDLLAKHAPQPSFLDGGKP
ncbi:MAG TPA: conserved phage C-terminal domain-containing protein [Kofleriaceae bacterium]|nr:conserved phage C-terminal domain-containing protein [Kofleriaceae bacterium]